MTPAAARIVMMLAIRCLGDDRREWALAMRAEFLVAEEDGRALPFAAGCLVAAWREMPTHEEGRLTLASYALALVLLVPMAAMLAANILTDFPLSYVGSVGAYGWPEELGGRAPTLNDGNRAAVPTLALLVVLLAASHLRIAWLVLDRDWTRADAVARLISAATMALVIFSGVAFADCRSALVQAAMSAVALTAVTMLRRMSPEHCGEVPA